MESTTGKTRLGTCSALPNLNGLTVSANRLTVAKPIPRQHALGKEEIGDRIQELGEPHILQ